MKYSVALALLLAASTAVASTVDVDTLYAKSDASGWLASGFGNTWIGQSFTPGVSGTLDRIDLQIWRFGPDDLRFRFGSGEAIAGTYAELLTIDMPAASVQTTEGGLVSVELSGYGIALQKGTLYSVILSSTQSGGGNQFGWIIGEVTPEGLEITNPSYPGGRAFASLDQGMTWQNRGVDRPLRTWMTAAVPEPATWAMFIAGFGLVGTAARRRRAAAPA